MKWVNSGLGCNLVKGQGFTPVNCPKFEHL